MIVLEMAAMMKRSAGAGKARGALPLCPIDREKIWTDPLFPYKSCKEPSILCTELLRNENLKVFSWDWRSLQSI